MIELLYQASDVVAGTTPPPKRDASVGERHGVVIINRSPWWMQAVKGPVKLFTIPSWCEAGLQIPPYFRDFTLQPYTVAESGVIQDWDVPNLIHGIWVDSEATIEKPYTRPIVTGQVPLVGGGTMVMTTSNPLTTIGPTSVVLPASNFNTTSLVVSPQFGVFHRNARSRYVIASNNLSVSITVYLVPFDDLGTATVPPGLTQDASNTYTIAAGNSVQFAYNSTPTMNAPLNSFYLGITPSAVGSTGSIGVSWIENI